MECIMFCPQIKGIFIREKWFCVCVCACLFCGLCKCKFSSTINNTIVFLVLLAITFLLCLFFSVADFTLSRVFSLIVREQHTTKRAKNGVFVLKSLTKEQDCDFFSVCGGRQQIL